MRSHPFLSARSLTAPLGVPTPALRRVNFDLGPGERVVLHGPSGSGKSTLLRALVLLEPATGEVLLEARAVTPATVRELRRRAAYLPQQPVPVAPTVEENLAFARALSRGVDVAGAVGPASGADADPVGPPDPGSRSRPLDETAQRRLLSRLGLAELDWSRRFTSLSGGEQQRVALVRSLTPGPDALLLDEPTASLDTGHVAQVVAVIRAWCQEDEARALVWVSHKAGEIEGLATRSVDVRDLAGVDPPGAEGRRTEDEFGPGPEAAP